MLAVREPERERAILAQQGKTAVEIEEAVKASAIAATPMANAMAGFFGALITGIIASAIIAVFVSAKPPSVARV